MFKRTLALLLAVCMLFDSSALTTLAAETETEVVSEVETEATETEAVETEETELVSEDVTIEEETNSEEMNSEEKTETEEMNSEEKTETEEENSEEETETEEENSEEETETEEENSEEETETKEENSEEETEVEEVNSEEETEIEEEKPEEKEHIVADSNQLPELSVGTENLITVPAYDDYAYANGALYSFTAPEAGYYGFYAVETEYDEYIYEYVYVDLFDSSGQAITDGYLSSYRALNMISDYMQEGETVTLRALWYDETQEASFNLSIRKIANYAMTKQTDGSYVAETEDYTFVAVVKSGYESLKFENTLIPKEEAVLEDSYYLYTCYINEKYNNMSSMNSTDSTEGTIFVEYDYKYSNSADVEQGNSYRIYYVLADEDTHEPIAMFNGDIAVTTKKTDKPYVIYDTQVTESSVTFNMETFCDGRVYYAPVEGADEEYSTTFYKGWTEDFLITELIPETEYKFEFVDEYGKTIGIEKATTLPPEDTDENSMTVVCDARLLEDGSTVELSIEVSGYKGDASAVEEFYKFTHIVYGEQSDLWERYYIGDIEADGENGKSFTISYTRSMREELASGKQFISVWLEIEGIRYGETAKEITMPASAYSAEDFEFNVVAGEKAGTAEYTISADVENGTRYDIYYKPIGASDWNEGSAIFSNMTGTGCSGIINNLQAGLTYDFILLVEGVKVETTATIGDPVIWLELEEAEINPFDLAYTFNVESNEALDDSYYLYFYYKSEYDEYGYINHGYEWIDAGSSVTYKTAEGYSHLKSDTDYQLKWELRNSDNEVLYTIYEDIHTPKAEITFELVENSLDEVAFFASMNPECVANFSTFHTDVTAYVREEGTNSYRRMSEVSLSSGYNYSKRITLGALKADTTYEVSFRSDDAVNYTEYAHMVVTTPADTRKVEVTSVTTGIDSAVINYTLSGMTEDRTALVLFIREKGTDNLWENWNGLHVDSGDSEGRISAYGLKAETTYEYKLGFADYLDTFVTTLTNVVEDEFTTLKDTREIEITSVDIGMDSVEISYRLNGMDVVSDVYFVYLFMREKGEEEWTRVGYNEDYLRGKFKVNCKKEYTTYEYLIGFCGSNYNIFAEDLQKTVTDEFTTLEDNRKVTIDETRAYIDCIEFSYTLSGMELVNGTTYIRVFIREKGADNQWIDAGYAYYSSGDALNQIVYARVPKENITYEYRIGFGEYDTALENLKNVVDGEATIPSDKRTLEIISVEGLADSAVVTYSLGGTEVAKETVVRSYIREKGSEDEWIYAGDIYYCPDVEYSDPVSGSVSMYDIELKEETVYECKFGFYNQYDEVFKEVTTREFTTLKDTRELTDLTVKTYLDSAEIFYDIKGSELVSYTQVLLYVREVGTENTWINAGYNVHERNGESSGSLLIDSDDGITLKENVTYEYKIGFGEDYDTGVNELEKELSGKFTMPEDKRSISIDSVKCYIDSAKLTYTLSGMEIVDFSYFTVYVREQGTEAWKYASSMDYSKEYSAGLSGVIDIGYYSDLKLKEDTTYEYIIGFGNYQEPVETLINPTKGFITTPKDMRAAEVVSVKPYFHNARVYYTLSGLDVARENKVLLYVKEAGILGDTENEWSYVDYNYHSENDNGTYTFYINDYKGAELKAGTTYEYIIGIGDYYTTFTTLKNMTKGTFTTAKDERTVTAQVVPGYGTANIIATFGGNEFETYSEIHYFYREKGTESWIYAGGRYTDMQSGTLGGITAAGLTSGKEYEYAVVVADNYIESPDAVTVAERKFIGEFTTKTNTYTLEAKVNAKSLAYNKGTVTVTAKNGNDSTLQITLDLYHGDNFVQSQTVVLKQAGNYTKDVAFTDLVGNTTYKVKNAAISVEENGYWVNIATVPCEASFTTKEAIIPTKIELSEDTIILNAYYGTGGDSDGYVEGFNAKTLTAKLTPSNASGDLLWNTENPYVASIMDDGTNTGMVYATGCGETEISARSKYDETIIASCKVKVVNYEIIYDNGEYQQHRPTEFTLYKGESLKGLAYYKVGNDDSKILLEGYTVTPVKSGIVSWSDTDKSLIAENVGETQVIFEKDGVKAYVTVKVELEPVGFAIGGLTIENSSYPVVLDAEDNVIAALEDGASYQIWGETSPVDAFEPAKFTWKSSDETVATVNNEGVVTPLKAGKVTITAAPPKGAGYKQEQDQITVIFKEVPASMPNTTIYAVTNIYKTAKLSMLALPEEWSWVTPDATLAAGGINAMAYDFEAVYTGEKFYPAVETVSVYISTITGFSIYETGGKHNQILQVGEDSMVVTVDVDYQGILSGASYEVKIPEVEGLTIEKAGNNFTVKASVAGTYTLKPEIYVGDTKLTFKKPATYKITAVEEVQAASIELNLAPETEGVAFDKENNKIIFESVEAKKNFVMNAIVKDSAGNPIDGAKVAWGTTDKAVATVKAEKNNTCKATITAKGEGHAVITVTAQDKTKYQTTFEIEIQNHTPRVNVKKATVNLAYDYEDYYGKSLASAAGLVEIVPVYGESITGVRLLDKNGNSVKGLAMEYYDGYNYLAVATQTNEELKTGNLACTLQVTTSAGKDYDYSFTVAVTNKKPTVKAKQSSTINLFYTNTASYIDFTVSDRNAQIKNIVWEDKSTGIGNGFAINLNNYYWNRAIVSQEDIEVVKGKLKDSNVAKGNLTFTFDGYKDTYELKNFAVKYNYKKPNIVSMSTSSTVAPALGQDGNGFNLYNKTEGYYIRYNNSGDIRYDSYTELTCNDENVDLNYWENADYIDYTYKGTKSSYKFTMTLDSALWRDSINVTHTVKVANPTPALSYGNVVFNIGESAKNVASTYVYMTNYTDIELAAIDVVGSNLKSQKLMDNNVIVFTTNEESGEIIIQQNDAAMMGEELKKDTYEYKITPYGINVSTGEKKALKTLKLKVKIIDTAYKASVSAKGSIDLSNGSDYDVAKKKNAIWVDAKYSNLSTGDQISGRRLTGEYSEYFKLGYESGHYFVRVNPDCLGSLKSGQTYKLAIESTVSKSDGSFSTVTSNTFSIKPKQSVPKITVSNNNQVLYAAADNLSRSYYISVPNYYSIESAYGEFDCNKDGNADIVVSQNSNYGYGCYLTVTIIDKDAAVATAKGKVYTIPVTVKLEGRDGIGKDATASLKVTVKR